MPVATMHRMALKASQKLILLMNNTTLLTRHHRLTSMNEILVYLTGHAEDEGMPGDRGDFYRRKLAEQLYHHFNIYNVDHTNVLDFVCAVVRLEHETRNALTRCPRMPDAAPHINVDDQVLDMVGRLSNVH